MTRENKRERCGEWERIRKQRDVLSGKVEQNREMWSVGSENKRDRCVELEGRAKQRDVLIGKVEQNREMC